MNSYILFAVIFSYLYLKINFHIPESLTNLYFNRYIQIMFLLGLLLFGNQSIYISLFIALNWLLFGLKIQEKQLLKDI